MLVIIIKNKKMIMNLTGMNLKVLNTRAKIPNTDFKAKEMATPADQSHK